MPNRAVITLVLLRRPACRYAATRLQWFAVGKIFLFVSFFARWCKLTNEGKQSHIGIGEAWRWKVRKRQYAQWLINHHTWVDWKNRLWLLRCDADGSAQCIQPAIRLSNRYNCSRKACAECEWDWTTDPMESTRDVVSHGVPTRRDNTRRPLSVHLRLSYHHHSESGKLPVKWRTRNWRYMAVHKKLTVDTLLHWHF